MILPPDIPFSEFIPWLIPTEPAGDPIISDDAPDDIKAAWHSFMARLESMYDTTEISD